MKQVRKAFADGDLLITPAVVGGDPAVVELFGALGFDWLMIDTEHSTVEPDGRRVEELVRAAQVAGVAPTIRVPTPEPRLIAKALDAGAQGIWVSRIETPEQARIAVQAARYAPEGRRGAAPIVRSVRFGVDDWDAYVERVNRETAVIIIVETAAGVEAVREIAAVPGIDAIEFGQFDFGVDIGLRQDEHFGGGTAATIHPRVREAAAEVLAAAQANGVAAGNVAWSDEVADEWIAQGFRLLIMETDTGLMAGAARALKSRIDGIQARLSSR